MPTGIMLEPPLLRLPLHIIAMVLSQLDNMQSLADAIFAHPALYASFAEDRDRVVASIMAGHIPERIRRYAMYTHATSSGSLDRSDMEQVRHFLQSHSIGNSEWIRDPFELPGPLNLHLASSLSRMHTIIQYFNRNFLSETLPSARRYLGLDRPGLSCTADEEFRIHRAMYRFQMYCNLFSYKGNSTRTGLYRLKPLLNIIIFGDLAPWVNKQLGCIHDYFERVLSRAFDEVAAHDIAWGTESVNWITVGRHNPHKQGYLLFGLPFLHCLSLATTYTDRLAILRSRGPTPPRTRHMLATQLYECQPPAFERRGWSLEVDRVEQNLGEVGDPAIIRAWGGGLCDGPGDGETSASFRLWRALYSSFWRERLFCHDDFAWLRRCGYALWDFDGAGGEGRAALGGAHLRAILTEGRKVAWLERFRRRDGPVNAAMRRSWRERRYVYKRGGRGHWAKGDLSRVE